jgi:soluble lytic murein transglycosylase-like protein
VPSFFSPVEFVTSIAGGEPVWLQRFNASPYVGIVEAASDVSQLPAGLLARLLWQESRYNPAAYNKGSKASGIAQIVPRWHPDVDPWNPDDAIPYAARYLRHLFDRFGSWRLALAGYNWGPGNLAKFGIDAAPAETLDYFGSILADVNDRYQSGLA